MIGSVQWWLKEQKKVLATVEESLLASRSELDSAKATTTPASKVWHWEMGWELVMWLDLRKELVTWLEGLVATSAMAMGLVREMSLV